MGAKLIAITPDAEKIMMFCARVSSPHQDSTDTRLLNYCVKHGHWSVFEMANMVVEVVTSRAVSAQIIRHSSIKCQEFSQRYAENDKITSPNIRMQDVKNRQNSLDTCPEDVQMVYWGKMQNVYNHAMRVYKELLAEGVAKECARMVLPMATETKLYMNGTVRSWIHYLQSRTHESTQLEHRILAEEIKQIFIEQLPIIARSLNYATE